MKFKIRKIDRFLNFEDQKYKSKVIEKIQTNLKKKNDQNNIKHICGIFNFEEQKFSSTFIDKKSNNFQQNLKNRQFFIKCYILRIRNLN